MIISDKHKFIFIKVPRTSSTSIEKYFVDELGLFCDPGKGPTEHRDVWSDLTTHAYDSSLHTHAKAKEVMELLSSDIWNSYYKCAFVRNPWDWASSQYFWNISSGAPPRAIFTETEAEMVISMMKRYELEGATRGEAAGPLSIQCQYNYLHDDDGNRLVDFIGNYENRTEDLTKIMKHLGFPDNPCEETVHFNRTFNNKMTYQEFYTDEAKEAIANAFAKDIAAFDYKF